MASKQISQQTFDDVVKENMREFEMSAEDALEDAVQQFESQASILTFFYTSALQSGMWNNNKISITC